MKKLKNLQYNLAAFATVGFLTSASDAIAGTGFQTATTNINASVSQVPSLISTVAYIGGASLGVLGVLKLKAHVDNPQTPLKDGLVRLGAGGGLLALPFVLDSMTSTIGTGGGVSPQTIPNLP